MRAAAVLQRCACARCELTASDLSGVSSFPYAAREKERGQARA